MDPYKVLGVTPQTSDDDVKRAYRELARKYHPDNYVNNPLADLAETRMKEINEAYDMIMNERRNPAGGSSGQQQSYGGAYNGQQYGGYQQRTYTGANAALYSQVRQAINQGNLGMAEALLQRAAGRDAEWFYLTGTVYYRKGWYDEAARAYTQACQMDRATRSISTRCRISICPAATAATGPCRRQACATAVCRRSSATAA
ncbi:MAG: J domain-containing protein [Butyricicoccaceae bacterium]